MINAGAWSSTDLPAAAARGWDVIIVGAGPAGGALSLQIAREGGRVLLLERARFPRPKVCGGCVGPLACSELDTLGLDDLPRRLGARPVRAVRLAAGDRSVTMPMSRGVAVSRSALDAAIVQRAIAAGVSFLDGCTGVIGAANASARSVRVRRGRAYADLEARVIVDARGLPRGPGQRGGDRSLVRGARIGLAATIEDPAAVAAVPPGLIAMGTALDGYVGVVRLERNSIRVAAALAPSAIRAGGGPSAVAASIVREGRGLASVAGALRTAGWRGTPHLTRRPASVADHRVFLVGDAAGYVEPFTGEGIGWALASAARLAPIAVAASRQPAWSTQWESAWRVAHHRVLWARHRRCGLVARALRHPRLVRGVVTAARLGMVVGTGLGLGWDERPAMGRPVSTGGSRGRHAAGGSC